MGELFRFLARHVVASLFGAAGVILLALGYADQAEAIATRFEPWQFQALGAAFFVVFVVMVLVSYDQKQLATPAATPSEDSETEGADTDRRERRERQRVIQSLDYAYRTAGAAMAESSTAGRNRAAERNIPRMKAAILSANKVFGTPIPPEGKGAVLDLELSRRMIERILPFLREGHIDEAQREGVASLVRFVSEAKREG